MHQQKISKSQNRLLFVAALLLLAAILILFTESCRKDIDSTGRFNKPVKSFFDLPPNTPGVVKKVVAEFKRQNKITGFVKELVAQNGMPLWDKSIINVNKRNNAPAARLDGDCSFEIEDTLVFTPLVEQDSLFVSGFFLSRITGDSVELHLYRGNDYDNYAYGRLSSDSLTAERITIQLMSLNTAVFGYKEFITTDSLLFKDDAPLDLDSVYSHTTVKLKEDPGSGFTSSRTCKHVRP